MADIVTNQIRNTVVPRVETTRPPKQVHPRRKRRNRERRTRIAFQVGIVVAVLAVMTILNETQGDLVMPRPDKVVQEGWDMFRDGTMWTALGQSVKVFVVGFAVAFGSGIIGGILVGGFMRFGRVVDPFINALN